MKTYHYLFFAILCIGCKVQPDAVRGLTKNDNQVNPPGTVWLRDSIYIDVTEVRNIDYLEYLYWLQDHDPKNYSAALPDTMVWRDPRFYNEPFSEYYLRHPAYYEYPVVGVSYDQATAFCKWRTERVKEMVKAKGKENSKKYHIYKNFEYRLPTEKEWEYAAVADTFGYYSNVYDKGIHAEYGYDKLIADKNIPKVWVKETALLFGSPSCLGDYSDNIFVSGKSLYPNRFGLYNMIGNVAEMVQEKGISKGGSTFNKLEECRITNAISYSEPSVSVGFRCVYVIR